MGDTFVNKSLVDFCEEMQRRQFSPIDERVMIIKAYLLAISAAINFKYDGISSLLYSGKVVVEYKFNKMHYYFLNIFILGLFSKIVVLFRSKREKAEFNDLFPIIIQTLRDVLRFEQLKYKKNIKQSSCLSNGETFDSLYNGN